MARWDVYRNTSRRGELDTPYLLDVQADLLVDLHTRLVVPLRRASGIPRPIGRLQPRLRIAEVDLIMDTPMMVGAPVSALGPRQTNVADQAPLLLGASDFLLTGI